MTTAITIELTDPQVDYLRSHFRYDDAPQLSCCVADRDRLIALPAAALPPEPIRLTIELPADVFAEMADQYPSWESGAELSPFSARALNAVVEAAKAHESAR